VSERGWGSGAQLRAIKPRRYGWFAPVQECRRFCCHGGVNNSGRRGAHVQGCTALFHCVTGLNSSRVGEAEPTMPGTRVQPRFCTCARASRRSTLSRIDFSALPNPRRADAWVIDAPHPHLPYGFPRDLCLAVRG
jgi:hypothetical protein